MGMQPSKDPAVAAGIPSLKWPLVWVAFTGYLVIACLADFTVDREADARDALTVFPFCLLCLLAAYCFYKHRIKQRQQWRDERDRKWLLADNMPAPPITDWDKIEADIAVRVANEHEKSPFDNPEVETILKLAPSGPPAPATSDHHPRDKGGRYKHPAGGMYWDYRDLKGKGWYKR